MPAIRNEPSYHTASFKGPGGVELLNSASARFEDAAARPAARPPVRSAAQTGACTFRAIVPEMMPASEVRAREESSIGVLPFRCKFRLPVDFQTNREMMAVKLGGLGNLSKHDQAIFGTAAREAVWPGVLPDRNNCIPPITSVTQLIIFAAAGRSTLSPEKNRIFDEGCREFFQARIAERPATRR